MCWVGNQWMRPNTYHIFPAPNKLCAMDTIDKVVYINLDRRTDRRAEIEAVLDQLGIPEEKRLRFPAISRPWGWIGCTQSHCEVVRMAKEGGWSRVWILEDDWMPTVTTEQVHSSLHSLLCPSAPAWDVLLLSSYVQASEEVPECALVRRGLNIQTASSYIVNSSFYEPLLKNLEEAVKGAEAGGNHWDCINDQYWKRLQADRTTRWLYFSPPLGKQRPSHSDLTGRFENYGV